MSELFTIARNEIHAKLFEEYKRFLHVLHLLAHLNIISALNLTQTTTRFIQELWSWFLGMFLRLIWQGC